MSPVGLTRRAAEMPVSAAVSAIAAITCGSMLLVLGWTLGTARSVSRRSVTGQGHAYAAGQQEPTPVHVTGSAHICLRNLSASSSNDSSFCIARCSGSSFLQMTADGSSGP